VPKTNLLALMESMCSSVRLGSEDCIARSIIMSVSAAGAGGGGDTVRPCARLHSPSLYGTRRSPTMLLCATRDCGGVGEHGSGSLAARGENDRTWTQKPSSPPASPPPSPASPSSSPQHHHQHHHSITTTSITITITTTSTASSPPA